MVEKKRWWSGMYADDLSASFGVAGPEEKSLHLHLPEEISQFIRLGITSSTARSPKAAFDLYESSTAVSVPVHYIAGAGSVVDPIIRLQDGTIIREHAVLDLLGHPSPDFTKELFMDNLLRNRLVTGECYIVALGSITQPPGELIPLSPMSVEPNRSTGGFTGHFQVTGEVLPGVYTRGRESIGIRFKRDRLAEIKQIRNFSTHEGSLTRGQSPLLSASSEIRQHVLGVHHNTRLLEQGGRLSLLVSFAGDMSPDDFEEAKRAIRKEFGGAGNAGKIAFTTGGMMDMKEMGMTNRDMDWGTLQDHAKMATASSFRFPLVLIFIEASSYNNYATAKIAMWDDATLPALNDVYGGLSDFLFPRYPDIPDGARLGVDEAEIPALVDRKLDEMVKRRAVNAETDNELRRLMGREDIGPAGDTIRDTASKVPLGEDFLGGGGSNPFDDKPKPKNPDDDEEGSK